MGTCHTPLATIFLLVLINNASPTPEEDKPIPPSITLNSNVTTMTSPPESPCTLKKIFLGNKKIFTCTNVTSSYLESRTHATNYSEWIHCEACALRTIAARTLNRFEPKNRILYLNVSACDVTTIVDYAFQDLPNLKVLFLRQNNLTHLTDCTFHSLRRLLQLDLSRNHLEKLMDDTFIHLQVLDILNLNFNSLQELQPKTFAGLKELKYLYMSHNDIVTVHPYLFKELVNLRILHLEFNKIKELSPLAFTNLNRLMYLYLNYNSIEFLTEYNFKELGELVDLQMRGNTLTQIGTSAFNGLRKLKFLYLGDNNISALFLHSFTGLDALTILDLTNNSLSAFTLDFLADMPELRGLWLESNYIEQLAISPTGKPHRNLASFDVKINHLDYFNYKMLLKQLECLEEIYVGENRFKCEFFVPMYDYFEESNVTLCLDASCDKNGTIWYTEKLCKLGFNVNTDEEKTNVDEVLSYAQRMNEYNIYLHIAQCIVLVYIFIEK